MSAPDQPIVPARVEPRSDTCYEVHVDDDTALVEVWADASCSVYAPTTDPLVCHGEPSSYFAAYTVAADGTVTQFDGVLTRVDAVGDSGRAIARAALEVWNAHPDHDTWVERGRRARLHERLDELDATVAAREAELAAAEARCDEARNERDVIRRLLLDSAPRA